MEVGTPGLPEALAEMVRVYDPTAEILRNGKVAAPLAVE